MPFLNILIGKPITVAQKENLQCAIADVMPTLPGKTRDNTIIAINDGYTMFTKGEAAQRAFVDVRLYLESPQEAKLAFAKKLYDIFEGQLGIAPPDLTINMLEMQAWGTNGNYA